MLSFFYLPQTLSRTSVGLLGRDLSYFRKNSNILSLGLVKGRSRWYLIIPAAPFSMETYQFHNQTDPSKTYLWSLKLKNMFSGYLFFKCFAESVLFLQSKLPEVKDYGTGKNHSMSWVVYISRELLRTGGHVIQHTNELGHLKIHIYLTYRLEKLM